jgi:hypothetical protein
MEGFSPILRVNGRETNGTGEIGVEYQKRVVLFAVYEIAAMGKRRELSKVRRALVWQNRLRIAVRL